VELKIFNVYIDVDPLIVPPSFLELGKFGSHVIGAPFADTITGDDRNNILEGGGGNDTMSGDAGRDVHIGGAGADCDSPGLSDTGGLCLRRCCRGVFGFEVVG